MRTKVITVTQKDIDSPIQYGNGLRSANSCPVARAICRVFKKKLGYAVVTGMGIVYIGAHRNISLVPIEAQEFIIAYDCFRAGRSKTPVAPFTFTLEY